MQQLTAFRIFYKEASSGKGVRDHDQPTADRGTPRNRTWVFRLMRGIRPTAFKSTDSGRPLGGKAFQPASLSPGTANAPSDQRAWRRADPAASTSEQSSPLLVLRGAGGGSNRAPAAGQD